MNTYQPRQKDIKRGWTLVDAKDQVLGRMATKIAVILMGKHKSTYSAHMDTGDYVVVINAGKVKLTGAKEENKVYRHHTGYPGGFREVSYLAMIKEHPERVIQHGVSGMLPDNRLKAKRLLRLKVFVDGKHPYADKFKN